MSGNRHFPPTLFRVICSKYKKSRRRKSRLPDNPDLALVVEKHRKVQGQLEVNHQNELKQIYQKNEETIVDKNRG